MAHKKAGKAVAPNRDSAGQHRGLKKGGGQAVEPGNIIVRQCGTRYHPGRGVGMGRDYTIFAKQDGRVGFAKRRGKTIVEVV